MHARCEKDGRICLNVLSLSWKTFPENIKQGYFLTTGSLQTSDTSPPSLHSSQFYSTGTARSRGVTLPVDSYGTRRAGRRERSKRAQVLCHFVCSMSRHSLLERTPTSTATFPTAVLQRHAATGFFGNPAGQERDRHPASTRS